MFLHLLSQEEKEKLKYKYTHYQMSLKWVNCNRTTLTSVGGPIAPVYVHGRFAIKESEFTSKEGNLSSSISSKLVFPADVEGDVVDNI